MILLSAGALAAGDPFRDANQKNGGDDGNDESKDVQFEDVPGAQQASDNPSYDRTGQPKQQRGDQAQILPAWLNEPRQYPDHETRNDETDHDFPSPNTPKNNKST